MFIETSKPSKRVLYTAPELKKLYHMLKDVMSFSHDIFMERRWVYDRKSSRSVVVLREHMPLRSYLCENCRWDFLGTYNGRRFSVSGGALRKAIFDASLASLPLLMGSNPAIDTVIKWRFELGR